MQLKAEYPIWTKLSTSPSLGTAGRRYGHFCMTLVHRLRHGLLIFLVFFQTLVFDTKAKQIQFLYAS